MTDGLPSPAGPPAAAAPGLPRWLLPVALIGVAILVVSVMPAFVARRRLERAETRLEKEIREKQDLTERIARDRRALASDEYVHDRVMRELLAPGPRMAAPTPPTR